MDVGRENLQRPLVGERHFHVRQRPVGIGCLRAVEPAQGNVRERFRHAVGAPNGVRKRAQFPFQCSRDGSSAQYQATGAAQQRTLMGHTQTFVSLHRREGGKVRGFMQSGEGMQPGSHGHEMQPSHHGAHHHHLAGYVAQGHGQQGRLPLPKPECRNGGLRTVAHSLLLYLHGAGSACAARGVYRKGGTWGVPSRLEIRQLQPKFPLPFVTVPQGVAL